MSTLIKNDPFYSLLVSDWFDSHPSTSLSKSSTKLLSKNIISKIDNDKLEIAVNVVGHDPKKISVDLTEDRIFIKSEKDTEDKSITNEFVNDLDETLRLGRDFNGLSAKATINNGLLHITVDKKEESKPKKLSIKF